MSRVERNQCERAGLDPLDDRLTDLRLDLAISHMSPPDQHVTTVEHAPGKALPGVVQTDGLHGNARLQLEVSGDLIAQKVGVSLFLGGLLFVPDDDSDRLALSRARDAAATRPRSPPTRL